MQVDSQYVVSSDKIPHALLMEVQVSGKNKPFLQIRAGNNLYIANKSQNDMSLQANAPIAQFGKGKFQMVKTGSEDPVVTSM